MKNGISILICPDSFKGSLTAGEVANIITSVITKLLPQTNVIQQPLSDGGEGMTELIKNSYPIQHSISVSDPLGRQITTFYNTDKDGQKVFIESANIIGFPLIKPEELNPIITTTTGLGEAIMKAYFNGAKEITVSLGGSATCDGGKGMLEALNLSLLKDMKFRIICDVTNPLLGTNGAVAVFAPQKGAGKKDLPILEERLEKMVSLSKNMGLYQESIEHHKGAGAAGGLGFAFLSFLEASYIRGMEYMFDITDFDNLIQKTDLVITGEGKLDRQSLMGKVITGVSNKARMYKKPLIIVAGKVEDKEFLESSGLKHIYEISDPRKTEIENLTKETATANLLNALTYILTKELDKIIKDK